MRGCYKCLKLCPISDGHILNKSPHHVVIGTEANRRNTKVSYGHCTSWCVMHTRLIYEASNPRCKGITVLQVLECHSTKPRCIRELYMKHFWGYDTVPMRGHNPFQVLECHSTKPRRIRELYEALWGYCTQVRGHNPQVSYPSHAAYVNFMKHFWGYCTQVRGHTPQVSSEPRRIRELYEALGHHLPSVRAYPVSISSLGVNQATLHT